MKIIFATGNKNKVVEVRELLKQANNISIQSLREVNIKEEIPETGDTLETNAREKALYVKSNYGYDCFSEDTGLEVGSLNGEPGVYSARYAGPDKNNEENIKKVLSGLKGKSDRKARFKTVICLLLEDREYLFEGIVNGMILPSKRGNNGFGYDPIFKPDGFDISFAEMSQRQKNEISHRGIAIRKLILFLQEYNNKKR